jgi:hypothetical protein
MDEPVDPDLERILREIREAAEWAETFRFEMTDEYLALIERVEALPQNQNGAVKSSRWLGSMAYQKKLRAFARLVPRDE